MGTKEKLIRRFMSNPKDFTFDELKRLFEIFGYSLENKGGTSGSRVMFTKGESTFIMHKPHPSNIIKQYIMKNAINFVRDNNLEEQFKSEKEDE